MNSLWSFSCVSEDWGRVGNRHKHEIYPCRITNIINESSVLITIHGKCIGELTLHMYQLLTTNTCTGAGESRSIMYRMQF